MELDDIIRSTGNGLKVYEYYQGYKIYKNKRYLSVFRNEKNPSMSFYQDEKGFWRCKDFGDAVNASIFDFVAAKYKLSFVEAVAKIKKDFDIISNYTPTKEAVKPTAQNYSNSSITITNIVYEEDIERQKYWKQYKYISDKILDKYNVKHFLSVNYINTKGVKKNTWKSNDQPAILYPTFELTTGELKHKFYFPYAKEKKNKWFGDTNMYCLFGYHENYRIYKTKAQKAKAILFSSLKDLMAFEGLMNNLQIYNGIHYIGFAGNSEIVITDYLYKLITRQCMIEPFDFFTLLDCDKKGIEISDNYTVLYHASSLTEILSNYAVPDVKLDVADFIKNNNEETIIKFATQIIENVWST
jgi:hypothetical protein